ncbi:MAG: T9SS type A sorting domain-containing protein, partial [Saprospiraceae bacterium]|nr:T9SS type A sorting domain-containing protein [Saprospiraceae bacterium]
SPAFITTGTPNPVPDEVAVNIWPNPVTDKLSIQADFEHPTDVSISMADARGASPLCPIHLHDVTMLNEQIPLSSMLPTGVYMLKVQTDENVIAVRKVIVQ